MAGVRIRKEHEGKHDTNEVLSFGKHEMKKVHIKPNKAKCDGDKSPNRLKRKTRHGNNEASSCSRPGKPWSNRISWFIFTR